MFSEDNITHWKECWNSSLPSSFIVSEEKQAERWDKRSDQFGSDIHEERKQKKTDDFFQLLQAAGFSPKGASVLDIGCGPGFLSIPLARAGARVTSLDISQGMLSRLQETADTEGLDIQPVACSWWSADIDKMGFRNSFDLVLASMTPGIKDVETFDLMISCSKKFCYYSNFIKKIPDKIPPQVMFSILGTTSQSDVFAAGLLYPFMYLYLQGYRPLVRITHSSVKRETGWEEAAEKAIDYLQISVQLSADKKEAIREYYQTHSPGGRYIADFEKYSGMMIWPVDTRMSSC